VLPILKEDEVAAKILEGIESGRQKLVMPPLVNQVPTARILPVAAFDRQMDVLGINRTMDYFTGRPGGRASSSESSVTAPK
jgi:all-trans-retinol dehydrogenase (NAD+)